MRTNRFDDEIGTRSRSTSTPSPSQLSTEALTLLNETNGNDSSMLARMNNCGRIDGYSETQANWDVNRDGNPSPSTIAHGATETRPIIGYTTCSRTRTILAEMFYEPPPVVPVPGAHAISYEDNLDTNSRLVRVRLREKGVLTTPVTTCNANILHEETETDSSDSCNTPEDQEARSDIITPKSKRNKVHEEIKKKAVQEEKEDNSRKLQRWKVVCIFISCLLLAAVAVVVGVGNMFGNDEEDVMGSDTQVQTNAPTEVLPSNSTPARPQSSTQSPSPAPTPSPTSLDRHNMVLEVLAPHLIKNLKTSDTNTDSNIFDSTSKFLSQHQLAAIQWLANTDAYSFTTSSSTLLSIGEEELIERYVLAALYFSTNGNDWDISVPYLSKESSVCNWNDGTSIGIFCATNGTTNIHDITTTSTVQTAEVSGTNNAAGVTSSPHSTPSVVKIELDHRNLIGSIPSDIGLLSNLINLSLRANRISGTMSSEIGNLSNLETLVIDFNNVGGSLPSEVGKLSMLRHLSLQGNSVNGEIPVELGLLTNLIGLNLASNFFEGTLSTQLGELSNLQQLDIGMNDIEGNVPSEIGDLLNLENLQLYSNLLTGTIPIEIGKLSNLVELSFGINSMSGTIPTELGNLSSLEKLSFDSNSLNGILPTEIGNLSNLIYINFGTNYFTGVPPREIATLPDLTIVDFSSNDFRGVLDPSFCERTNPVYIDIKFTALTCTCC